MTDQHLSFNHYRIFRWRFNQDLVQNDRPLSDGDSIAIRSQKSKRVDAYPGSEEDISDQSCRGVNVNGLIKMR